MLSILEHSSFYRFQCTKTRSARRQSRTIWIQCGMKHLMYVYSVYSNKAFIIGNYIPKSSSFTWHSKIHLSPRRIMGFSEISNCHRETISVPKSRKFSIFSYASCIANLFRRQCFYLPVWFSVCKIHLESGFS